MVFLVCDVCHHYLDNGDNINYRIDNMSKTSYHILRVGCGITFFWIAVLIIKNPMAWGFLMQKWAVDLLPFGVVSFMYGVALFDLILGFLLLTENFIWLMGLLGAFHFIGIFITIGITDVTIRDIGLMAALLVLFLEDMPIWIKNKLPGNWGQKKAPM